MGLGLFLVADIAKLTIKEVLKEMLPYCIPLLVTLLLITYIPAVATWIPRMALGNQSVGKSRRRTRPLAARTFGICFVAGGIGAQSPCGAHLSPR